MLCETGLIQANSRTLLLVMGKMTHQDTILCAHVVCRVMSAQGTLQTVVTSQHVPFNVIMGLYLISQFKSYS